jgi:hypothetical protein
MEITRQQFQTLAPAALPATVDALFVSVAPNYPDTLINFILADNGLTEPAALAQFLAAVHISSVGFTQFNQPFYGVSPMVWLTCRASQWTKAKLAIGAELWDWQQTAWDAAWLFDWPTLPWLLVNDTLTAVCVALGVEEGFADEPEDHGAMEM